MCEQYIHRRRDVVIYIIKDRTKVKKCLVSGRVQDIELNVRFWPIPPIQDSQILGYWITALRHIADRHPSVSRIGTIGQ